MIGLWSRNGTADRSLRAKTDEAGIPLVRAKAAKLWDRLSDSTRYLAPVGSNSLSKGIREGIVGNSVASGAKKPKFE